MVIETQAVFTGVTTGGGAAIAFYALKRMIDALADRFSKNGKGDAPVNVNVEVPRETPPHASTTGKRICDYHVPMLEDIVEVKGDVKVLKETVNDVKDNMNKITKSQLELHSKTDVIMTHFGLSQYMRRS